MPIAPAPCRSARAEPRHSTFAGDAPDGGHIEQILRIARARVPVVALHVLTGLREQHAAHRVTRSNVAREEPVRVAVDAYAALRANTRAFRVAETRIDCQPRSLATARKLDRLLRVQCPRKIETQIRKLRRQEGRISEPRTLVGCGVPRNGAGLGHHVVDRGRRQIRRAGRTLAGTEINGDTEGSIALILDGLHLAEPHRHAQASREAGIHLGLRGAGARSHRKCRGHDGFELGNTGGVNGLRHEAEL